MWRRTIDFLLLFTILFIARPPRPSPPRPGERRRSTMLAEGVVTNFQVSTSAELQNALNVAVDGDVISVAAGKSMRTWHGTNVCMEISRYFLSLLTLPP